MDRPDVVPAKRRGPSIQAVFSPGEIEAFTASLTAKMPTRATCDALAKTWRKATEGVDTEAFGAALAEQVSTTTVACAELAKTVIAESFAVDESTKASFAVIEKAWRRSTAGVDLEAAAEFGERMADNPRLSRRYGHLPITTAPVLLRILDRASPRQVPPRRSSCGRPVRRARVRRHRARSRSPGRSRPSDDPNHHHVVRRPAEALA